MSEEKPACKQCPIHCYQPVKRAAMKQVMRWAGPRMLIYHPYLAIRHLIDDKKPVPALPAKKILNVYRENKVCFFNRYNTCCAKGCVLSRDGCIKYSDFFIPSFFITLLRVNWSRR